MAKPTTAQKLVAYERLASAIWGAGVGFWAATIFADRGMPMERFYLMSAIAIGLMVGGWVVRLLTNWYAGKIANAHG